MVIRELDLSDPVLAEELWALQHAAYRQEARTIGVRDLPPLMETVHSLRNCGETFFGCFSADEELAGAISIKEEQRGERVISRIMVRPDCLRQGIATRILRHVLELAPAGIRFVVNAEARNLPAIRLYERFGFVPAGTFKPAPHLTIIRFEKRA